MIIDITTDAAKARLGQIALMALIAKSEGEGVVLKPSTTKREVNNLAKTLGVTTKEAASLISLVIGEAYKKVTLQLEDMMADPTSKG